MVELKFKPKQSDCQKPLLYNTVLYYLAWKLTLIKTNMITANGGGKYIPMRVPALERGRQKRKQETGVKFISCFFTLQTTTEFYWGERTQERIRIALPLSL